MNSTVKTRGCFSKSRGLRASVPSFSLLHPSPSTFLLSPDFSCSPNEKKLLCSYHLDLNHWSKKQKKRKRKKGSPEGVPDGGPDRGPDRRPEGVQQKVPDWGSTFSIDPAMTTTMGTAKAKAKAKSYCYF